MYQEQTSDQVVGICIILAVVGVLIWFIFYRLEAKNRLFELQGLIVRLKHFEKGETCALDYYKRGIHLFNYYLIPFTKAGLKNKREFRDLARDSLRRSITELKEQYHRDLRDLQLKKQSDHWCRQDYTLTITRLEKDLATLEAEDVS